MPATTLTQSRGLDRETKQKIRALVLKLRHLLQDDFAKQLRRFGIEVGKPFNPKSIPGYLTDDEKRIHRVIVATIQRDAINEGSHDRAIAAYIRECAYTLLNRLVGLKCMEAREILFVDGEKTEAVTTRSEFGDRSRLLWQMREESRDYRSDETRLWRDGLTRAFRAATQDIAVLFDPDDEYSQLLPTHRTLMEAIQAINQLETDCPLTPHSALRTQYSPHPTSSAGSISFSMWRKKSKSVMKQEGSPVHRMNSR